MTEWRRFRDSAYEASDAGEVRRAGRILRPRRMANRMLAVNIHTRQLLVHRIIAETFLGPCPPGLQINHKDFDRGNNALANLEYVTAAQNTAHAGAGGRMNRRGAANGRARLSSADVGVIRTLRGKVTGRELAARYGVSPATISMAWTGRTWTRD